MQYHYLSYSQYGNILENSMTIYNFYHIWADGKWIGPTDDHINVLKSSGLVSSVDKTYFGIVGSEDNREMVKKFLGGSGINFEVCVEKDIGYEQETMDKILELPDKDAYIFYSHTKGSYNNTGFEHVWRRSMNDDLIVNWQECVGMLDKFAAVGCHYVTPEGKTIICHNEHVKTARGFFYGTFFWTHLRYLKLMGSPERLPAAFGDPVGTPYNRIGAEYWMLKLKEVVDDKPFKVQDINPYFDEQYWKDHKKLGGVQ